ncbi:MAG: zinc-ribbon domain-containing protein [Candidatus Bathyarchaeia archaeon]
MPDVVCEKCGTQFMLATRMGQGLFGGGLHAQLIEKNQPPQMAMPMTQSMSQPVMQQAPTGSKFCHGCGSPINGGATFCTKCGAKVA